MTKRPRKKTARVDITAEGKPHQEAYDRLKDMPGFTKAAIAEEPSNEFRVTGFMCVAVVLRSLQRAAIQDPYHLVHPATRAVIIGLS